MAAWYRRWPFLAGITLIVITNVAALGSALHNRSGAPQSALTLTQRELSLPFSDWPDNENSGVALRLVWETEEPSQGDRSDGWYSGQAAWLDAAKLAELGVTVRPRTPRNLEGRTHSDSLPADVLLVLEMNGDAYQRELNRVCRIARISAEAEDRRKCDWQRDKASRLFVVDAGLERDALRARYPNTKLHAIVHGQVRATISSTSTESRVKGIVNGLSSEEIQVPANLRAALGSWTTARNRPVRENNPRFTATVVFGRRLEPWLVALKPH